MDGGIVQSWNKKSQKWVKIDTSKKGGILDMREEKFPGIPVKNGKPTDEDKGPVENLDTAESSKDDGWIF